MSLERALVIIFERTGQQLIAHRVRPAGLFSLNTLGSTESLGRISIEEVETVAMFGVTVLLAAPDLVALIGDADAFSFMGRAVTPNASKPLSLHFAARQPSEDDGDWWTITGSGFGRKLPEIASAYQIDYTTIQIIGEKK